MMGALLFVLISMSVFFEAYGIRNAIQGTKCSKNQVFMPTIAFFYRLPLCLKTVYKMTVYEDGAIEAECGPIPCGECGVQCLEEQSSCKAESDVFSGMKWGKNGQRFAI